MSMVENFLCGFAKSAVIVRDAWRISHVRFSSGQGETDDAILYISSPDGETVLCRNGENKLTVTGSGIGEVFNAISEKMNYYNQWEVRALNAVSMSTSSLDSLALLQKLFPDYVVKVVSPLGKFLYSGAEDADLYIDSSFISILRNIPACYKIALGMKGVTVFWEHEHYRRNIMLGNIVFSDNSYVMFSVIEQSKPLTETEQHLARMAQSIFEKLKLTIKLQNIIEPYESTLTSLFNGEEVSDSMLRSLTILWNYKIQNGAYLVLISNTRNQKFGNRAIVSSINEKISTALAFTYERQVLCFLPSGSFSKNSKLLEDIASPSRSDIVFSTWIGSWEQASYAYRQLDFILSKAREKPDFEHVIYCADYIWDFYLWTLQEPAGNMLVHPDILALHELDGHDKYLKTLYCFLKNNCRMAPTAEQLNIHLSTLKYRMEKISSVISFDPENYRSRMAFLISYDLALSSGKFAAATPSKPRAEKDEVEG
jgi:hypothetical protein